MIQQILAFSIIFGIFDGFLMETEIIGSAEIGFQPKSAIRVCESKNGKLADIKTNSTLKTYVYEKLIEKCDPNGFCPKMCVLDSEKSIKTPKFEENLNGNGKFITMTEPVYKGDQLVIVLEMPENSMEVIQLSDNLLENLKIGQNAKIPLQLTLYNRYSDPFTGKLMNGIVIGSGFITRKDKGFEVSTELQRPTEILTIANGVMSGKIELQLEFNKERRLFVKSPQIFGKDTPAEIPVEELEGRTYFTKFYPSSRLIDAYFMRGNCTKSEFYHFPANSTGDDVVNCFFTKDSKTAIPVFSCRKASYVACDGIQPHFESTTTMKIPSSTSKLTSENIKMNAENGKLFYDYVEELKYLLIGISSLSFAFLIAAIALQFLSLKAESKIFGNKKGNKSGRSEKK